MDIETIKDLQIDYKKLAVAREEKGLTQAQAAREIGIDRRILWLDETGKAVKLANITKMKLV